MDDITADVKRQQYYNKMPPYRPMQRFNKKRSAKNAPRSVAARGPKFKRNYFATHISAMPQLFNEQLRWSYVLAPTSIGVGTFVELDTVTLNGLFQAHSIGASQAVGFAKLIAIYQKAYVKAAKITVTFNVASNSGGSTPAIPALCGVSINTLPGALTTTAQAIGEGLCRYEIVSDAQDQKKMSVSCDIKKFLSVKDLLAGSQFYNTSAANPSQVVDAHVWSYNYGGAGTFVAAVIDVEYDVIFADPLPFT